MFRNYQINKRCIFPSPVWCDPFALHAGTHAAITHQTSCSSPYFAGFGEEWKKIRPSFLLMSQRHCYLLSGFVVQWVFFWVIRLTIWPRRRKHSSWHWLFAVLPNPFLPDR